MNPYLITEPTVISFSGGRTSAYMLYKVLEANSGLPKDGIVCFANTGKEEEATLKFVNDCSVYWDVPISWVEYRDAEVKFELVTYETASRNGEPFEALIRKRGIVPNPRNKSCTEELKIRAVSRYIKSIGWTEWQSFVGIRADEMHRAIRLKGDSKGEKPYCPLAKDNVTKEIVGEFWRNQSFDLELPNINGVTPLGNCDLCYLKAEGKIKSIIQQNPEKAIWWAKMEQIALEISGPGNGALFRIDRPSYSQLIKNNASQLSLLTDDAIECFCGD